ncbi:rod-binding protein [Enterobacter ludwigii]|uniref:rod-binding protein n=1 Tax=Enterobacter ludwigii TaxID=299767 RepID=UPI003F6FFD18
MVSALDSINTRRSVIPGDIGGAMKPQGLEQAAEQFEALFLHSMLKSMRQSSDALFADNPFSSKQQEMLRDFADEQLASHLAASHSSGITQMIMAQLGPQPKKSVKNTAQMVAFTHYP